MRKGRGDIYSEKKGGTRSLPRIQRIEPYYQSRDERDFLTVHNEGTKTEGRGLPPGKGVDRGSVHAEPKGGFFRKRD